MKKTMKKTMMKATINTTFKKVQEMTTLNPQRRKSYDLYHFPNIAR